MSTKLTELIAQAGVKPRHVQRFFKCSRVTASSWVNGRTQPHAMLEQKVQVFSAAVHRALDAGDLPVPDTMSFTEANETVLDILRRHARAVVEASRKNN